MNTLFQIKSEIRDEIHLSIPKNAIILTVEALHPSHVYRDGQQFNQSLLFTLNGEEKNEIEDRLVYFLLPNGPQHPIIPKNTRFLKSVILSTFTGFLFEEIKEEKKKDKSEKV